MSTIAIISNNTTSIASTNIPDAHAIYRLFESAMLVSGTQSAMFSENLNVDTYEAAVKNILVLSDVIDRNGNKASAWRHLSTVEEKATLLMQNGEFSPASAQGTLRAQKYPATGQFVSLLEQANEFLFPIHTYNDEGREQGEYVSRKLSPIEGYELMVRMSRKASSN